MSRFGQTEKTIFALAMIVFMTMSYFLYDDSLLFPQAQTGKLELIGNVATSENDVRRKNLDTFSWIPASKKDQIYENDSIFTGDRSEAEIRLQQGALIKIHPNSLVTLNLKNGQMLLDLRYGNLEGGLQPGSSLTIKSGHEEFVIQGKNGSAEKSTIKLKKAHSGKVDVKLLSGQATFTNKKKQTSTELPKDTVVTVTKAGEMRPLEKLELHLITADNLNWVREMPDAPVPFEWTSKGDIAKYEFEVSPKEDFSVISSSQRTSEQKIQMTDPLEPGSYYWRLKALDQKGQVSIVSNTQRFNISHLPKPQVVPPVASPASVVTPPAPTLPTPPSIATKDVAPNVVPPDRPLLVTKKIEFKVPSLQDRDPASLPAPKILWKPVAQVKNYQLQISKNEAFTEAQKYDLKGSQAVWNQYHPGQYYYRVYARGLTGLMSQPSEVGTLDIQVGDVTLNPFKAITIIGKAPIPIEAPISWNEIPFAKSYLVQIDKDQNFSQPRQMEYPANTGSLAITAPGLYQVRVQALDKDNKPLTEFSNIEEVLYTFRSPLNSPPLLEPFNNASIFLQAEIEPPFIWLEWKKVEGSISYSIEISDKPDFSRILIAKSLTENRYLVKDRVPLGKIYWRVRANAKEAIETSPWTEKREFTLYHQKNETFVK